MNLAVILIRCSTAETPLVLEKFSSKMRFRNVPTDRWSEDDIRVRGARGWTAIVNPLLLLPHEHDACRAISRAMQTDVIGAMWETVSGTFVFGLHRSGSPVRSFSVSDGIVVHSSGEPLAGEPPLAEMTVHDVMRLVERAAIPVNAIEDADDLLHLGMELVQKLDPLDEAEYRAHWPAHQQMMTLAVTQFPPEISTVTRMIGRARGPYDRAWNALSGALGVAGAVVGERRTAAGPGVPSLAGIVEPRGTHLRKSFYASTSRRPAMLSSASSPTTATSTRFSTCACSGMAQARSRRARSRSGGPGFVSPVLVRTTRVTAALVGAAACIPI